MTYNLLAVEPLPLDAVTVALAECLHVRAQDVDVADEDTDLNHRNWDAQVLCEKTSVLGDVAVSLDIYAQDAVYPQPTERELASAFAQAARTVVLFPAEEPLPSAYWLATEDGLTTRARLYDSDDDEPRYTINVVEDPVPQLPHVPVARIAEVVREQQVATPLADAFAAQVQRVNPEESNTAGTPLWLAGDRLCAWEKLVRQMSDGWAPSGWYPSDLYRERLETRDELDQLSDQLPETVSVLFQEALSQLDTRFTELTVEDTGLMGRELTRSEGAAMAPGWWWNRRPEPLPW